MSDFGDVIWRLTVRDLQGKIVFGPRTYLSDKPMRAAVKRWEGRDVSVLREFAVRGAWQNMDAVAVAGSKDPWHEEAPIYPDDEMTPEELAEWEAMSDADRAAYLTMPLVAPPLPKISIKRGGLSYPGTLSQEEWERQVKEALGVED